MVDLNRMKEILNSEFKLLIKNNSDEINSIVNDIFNSKGESEIDIYNDIFVSVVGSKISDDTLSKLSKLYTKYDEEEACNRIDGDGKVYKIKNGEVYIATIRLDINYYPSKEVDVYIDGISYFYKSPITTDMEDQIIIHADDLNPYGDLPTEDTLIELD